MSRSSATFHRLSPSPCPRPAPAGIAWSTDGTSFSSGRPWLDSVVDYLDSNRLALADLIEEHLHGVRYTPPQGTYIAWLDCRDLGIEGSLEEFFREKAGVALTDGLACGGAGEGFVRMIFATPRPILEQAVISMGEAVRASRQNPVAPRS